MALPDDVRFAADDTTVTYFFDTAVDRIAFQKRVEASYEQATERAALIRELDERYRWAKEHGADPFPLDDGDDERTQALHAWDKLNGLRLHLLQRTVPTDLRMDKEGRIWSYYRDHTLNDLIAAVPWHAPPYERATAADARRYLAAIDEYLDAKERG